MADKQAKITYYGHSTVIIETEAGKRIIIDPYLDANPVCPEELRDPGPVDYLCLTHGHSDHSSSAVTIAKKYGPRVFATYELAELLIQDGVPQSNVELMNKGGRISIPNSGGLAVNLTNAFHSSSYQASNGTLYYAGEAAGIIIELESGRSVYHAGDTSLFSDMKLIADRFKPVLALLPIGDRFTMGPEDAAKAVEIIKPQVVIPIHHSTFPLLSGRPEEFQELLSGSSTKVEALSPGESCTF